MEELEQRWEFLRQWTDALRGRIIYGWPRTQESIWAERSLAVNPPTRIKGNKATTKLGKKRERDFLAALQKFREALALLSAVGHVDKVAWRYLLETHCDVTFGVEGEDVIDEEIPVRFRLNLQDGDPHLDKSRDDLVRWFGTSQRTDASQDFLETLQQVADVAGNLRKDKPGVDIVISVSVHFSAPVIIQYQDVKPGALKPLESTWIAEMKVHEEWEAFDGLEKDVQPGSLRCTFKLEPMALNFGDSDITHEMVDVLETLALDNVTFSYLSIWVSLANDLRRTEFVETHKFGQLMQYVFGSTRHPRELAYAGYHLATTSTEASPPQTQNGSIDLYCDFSASGTFEAMCSAICSAMVTNQSTTKLCIYVSMPADRINHAECVHKWKWLAYAFFSKRARECSALESLVLAFHDSLTVEYAEAIASILTSEHPEEDLCGCPRGQVPERDATLMEGSPIYWRLTSSGQPSEGVEPLVLTLPCSVRTFSDDGKSELVNAVVPGFGWCLVERSDLVLSETKTTPAATCDSISSLFLEFNDAEWTNLDGLSLLLASVGMSLKSLTLSFPGQLANNVILRCCPNLEELAIYTESVKVRLDFSSYHARKQPLPTLDCNWNDVGAVVQSLSDINSPVAKCARRLRLKLLRDWCHIEAAELEKISKMLEVNHYLEYVDVVALPSESTDINGLRKYHYTRVSRALPLATESKVALLSVLPSSDPLNSLQSKRRRPKAGSVAASSCRLDADVLSNVFAFAATPVLRQVYARLPRDEDDEYQQDVLI